jgi:hypothetical protein
MRPESVREALAAAPVRGLGKAHAVANAAGSDAKVLKELVEAGCDSREVVSRRAANALKKVQAVKPELLVPYAGRLVRMALDCEELRTRWNLTLVVGELPLKGRDRKLAVELMFEALESASGFLRAFAMQGLVNLAEGDAALRARVRCVVEKGTQDSSAAVRARARRLLASRQQIARSGVHS